MDLSREKPVPFIDARTPQGEWELDGLVRAVRKTPQFKEWKRRDDIIKKKQRERERFITVPESYDPPGPIERHYPVFVTREEKEDLLESSGRDQPLPLMGLPAYPPISSKGSGPSVGPGTGRVSSPSPSPSRTSNVSSPTGPRGPTGPQGQPRSSPAGNAGGAPGAVSRSSNPVGTRSTGGSPPTGPRGPTGPQGQPRSSPAGDAGGPPGSVSRSGSGSSPISGNARAALMGSTALSPGIGALTRGVVPIGNPIRDLSRFVPGSNLPSFGHFPYVDLPRTASPLISRMIEMQAILGQPMTIHSGYRPRTKQEAQEMTAETGYLNRTNALRGGVKNSQHMHETGAIDFSVDAPHADVVRAASRAGITGINQYPSGSWHMDMGPRSHSDYSHLGTGAMAMHEADQFGRSPQSMAQPGQMAMMGSPPAVALSEPDDTLSGVMTLGSFAPKPREKPERPSTFAGNMVMGYEGTRPLMGSIMPRDPRLDAPVSTNYMPTRATAGLQPTSLMGDLRLSAPGTGFMPTSQIDPRRMWEAPSPVNRDAKQDMASFDAVPDISMDERLDDRFWSQAPPTQDMGSILNAPPERVVNRNANPPWALSDTGIPAASDALLMTAERPKLAAALASLIGTPPIPQRSPYKRGLPTYWSNQDVPKNNIQMNPVENLTVARNPFDTERTPTDYTASLESQRASTQQSALDAIMGARSLAEPNAGDQWSDLRDFEEGARREFGTVEGVPTAADMPPDVSRAMIGRNPFDLPENYTDQVQTKSLMGLPSRPITPTPKTAYAAETSRPFSPTPETANQSGPTNIDPLAGKPAAQIAVATAKGQFEKAKTWTERNKIATGLIKVLVGAAMPPVAAADFVAGLFGKSFISKTINSVMDEEPALADEQVDKGVEKAKQTTESNWWGTTKGRNKQVQPSTISRTNFGPDRFMAGPKARMNMGAWPAGPHEGSGGVWEDRQQRNRFVQRIRDQMGNGNGGGTTTPPATPPAETPPPWMYPKYSQSWAFQRAPFV
jgi:hypothetical protein